MRWSGTLVSTLKETPQEAEIPSHQLMLRAGLIRKLSGGLYTFLPLGLRALRKVERIVREEMDRAGAIEVLMPALHPREVWEQSGRYDVLREVMFKIKDRQARDFVLGPTHEEIITDLVSHELNSYRQLPKTFYQVQAKFRDEIRPRFGLMRAKEFVMKDAYSFDADWAGVDKSYQAMYDAYVRIFARCGLRTKVVEADTGAMGGSSSHEFMVLADAGEDGIVECADCSYAANMEKAELRTPGAPAGAAHGDERPAREVSTPSQRTIEEVSAFLKVAPGDLVKTLLYLYEGEPIAVLVPGDRDLNEHKLARVLGGGALAMADDATIQRVTGAPVGFSGPVGLKIPLYADVSLRTSGYVVTGANKAHTHLLDVRLARDTEIAAFHDLIVARQGDGCPRCSGILQEKRGIEVGHVFKLGTKYSKSFNAMYLDDKGERQLMIMGCYGIGVTRTLQAIIEQSHDENGIIWPAAVAPYPVAMLVLSVRHAESMAAAERLTQELEALGLDVLFDDRDERPGVKFKDADLLGLPLRLVISERTLADGKVELKRRAENEKLLVPIAEAAAQIKALLS